MHERTTIAYRHASATGASPVGIVVALYDTILRDFRRAQPALSAGDVQTRVFELNHALTVIAHLRSVLNYERGKEAATRLQRLYDVTRAMILAVNANPDPQTLAKLTEMYSSVRMAWHQVEQEMSTRPPKTSPNPFRAEGAASNTIAAREPSDTTDSNRGSWRA